MLNPGVKSSVNGTFILLKLKRLSVTQKEFDIKKLIKFALFFFFLSLISVGGTLYYSEIQVHYVWEGVCIYEDYHFFWKYHTHPKLYLDERPNFKNETCKKAFKYYDVQGHPTFYPIILNALDADFEIIKFKLYDGSYKGRMLSNVLITTIVSWEAFIFLTFFILRDLYGERQAIIGSVFASVSPWIVRFADNDITVMVFFFLAMYSLIKASQSKRKIWYINYGIYAGFSLGLKFASFALIPITLILHRDRKLLISFVIAIGIMSLFSYPTHFIIEILDSSGEQVSGLAGYLAEINFYFVALAIFITLLYRKKSETDKFFLVWLWFFALMPKMIYTDLVYTDPTIQIRRVTIVFPALIALISNKLVARRSRSECPDCQHEGK